jgi:hypothetical protein
MPDGGLGSTDLSLWIFRQSWLARDPGYRTDPPQTKQLAEKVSEGPVFVAQPFLAVWFFQHLAKAHSQEWLCYLNPIQRFAKRIEFTGACN